MATWLRAGSTSLVATMALFAAVGMIGHGQSTPSISKAPTPEAQIADAMQEDRSFGVVGVGFGFQQVYPTINAVVEHSPGEKANMKVGDVLLAIDGHDTAIMCRRQIAWALRGPVSTPVKLTLLTANDKIVVKTVHRLWPGYIPNKGIAGAYLQDTRPADAGRTFQSSMFDIENMMNSEEKPWCLSNGPVEIHFADKHSAPIKFSSGGLQPLKLEHPTQVFYVTRFPVQHPHLVPLECELSMDNPLVRQFAAHFGIEKAPAKILLGPSIGGYKLRVEKNFKQDSSKPAYDDAFWNLPGQLIR